MSIGRLMPWLAVGILAAFGVGAATQSALVTLAIFIFTLAVALGAVVLLHIQEEAARWQKWGPRS